MTTATTSDDLDSMPSRAASDALLKVLSDGRWRPRSWARFLGLATGRSIAQARANPRALAEVSAIHVAMALAADRRGRLWVAVSWLMAATHLGMLDGRSSIGVPNALTLVRANLPAVENRLGSWVPIASLATDFVDGKLARATGAVTPFGSSADFLADTAVWTWFTLRHESSRAIRIATFAAWAAPVVGLTAASFAKGRLVELPRSAWLRPAAAMEVLIGVRFVLGLLRR